VQTEPISDALLDAIQAKVIIVADSEFPATERAKPALRERIEARGVPVFYTRQAGAVTVTLRPKTWNLHVVTGQRLSEWLRTNAADYSPSD
jgi:beta-lactamase superfamily II metal-dependent hydrolase